MDGDRQHVQATVDITLHVGSFDSLQASLM